MIRPIAGNESYMPIEIISVDYYETNRFFICFLFKFIAVFIVSNTIKTAEEYYDLIACLLQWRHEKRIIYIIIVIIDYFLNVSYDNNLASYFSF